MVPFDTLLVCSFLVVVASIEVLLAISIARDFARSIDRISRQARGRK